MGDVYIYINFGRVFSSFRVAIDHIDHHDGDDCHLDSVVLPMLYRILVIGLEGDFFDHFHVFTIFILLNILHLIILVVVDSRQIFFGHLLAILLMLSQ
jgi:hypothetical protein